MYTIYMWEKTETFQSTQHGRFEDFAQFHGDSVNFLDVDPMFLPA